MTTPGDIHMRGWVNSLIDEDMDKTEQFDVDLGEMSDGEDKNVNISLFEGWAYSISFWLELYDSDLWGTAKDSYGTWTRYYDTSEWTLKVDYNSGDAFVNFTNKILAGPNSITADELLEAYKPYLYIDVETIYNDPAKYVFGRVVYGMDQQTGLNSFCLQYIFYYTTEYTGTNKFVHYWDFEELLIYINTTNLKPYRLVMDNGFYFQAEKDWCDGQKYFILEWTSNGGEFQRENEFTEDLKPLLGDKRTMTYTVVSMNYMYDSGVENWTISWAGLPTFQLTVETSYHQFDAGDSMGGGSELGIAYSIQALNDSWIRGLFRSLDTSFSEGIHEVNPGDWTPNYSPFSFDICQPFTRPYILNNFPLLMNNINAYNDAKNYEGGLITLDKNVNITLIIPITTEMNAPESIAAGDITNTSLSFTLHSERALLIIDYYINVSIHVDLFFWEEIFNSILKNDIVINFSNPIIGFITDLVNFNDNVISFPLIDNYIDVTAHLTPQILGTILNATVNIHINEIIKSILPTHSYLVDLFVDDLALVLNPVIIGYMDMDLYSGTNLIKSNLRLISTTHSEPISFATPQKISESFQISLKNLRYGTNFQMDWTIEADWAIIPSLIFSDIEYNFLTWPNMDINLSTGTSKCTTANYTYIDGYWVLEGAQINGSNIPVIGIPLFNEIMIFTTTIVLTFIINKMLKQKKHQNKN